MTRYFRESNETIVGVTAKFLSGVLVETPAATGSHSAWFIPGRAEYVQPLSAAPSSANGSDCPSHVAVNETSTGRSDSSQ